MKAAIVTCCSPDWLPLAAVTLISSFRNTRLPADYFVVTNSLAVKKQLEIASAIEKIYGFDLKIIQIDEDDALENINSENSHPSVFFRLMIHTLIPDSYDRILYLDSDTLVLGSIDELIAHDLIGAPLAAVEDQGMKSSRRRARVNNAINFNDDDLYFNAGVILFDWKKTLSEQILQKARKILEVRSLPFADQDALNSIMRGRWSKLPYQYNVGAETDQSQAPIIKHFMKGRKPWMKRWRPSDKEYRKYYRKTLKSIGRHDFISTPATFDELTWLLQSVKEVSRRYRSRYRLDP